VFSISALGGDEWANFAWVGEDHVRAITHHSASTSAGAFLSGPSLLASVFRRRLRFQNLRDWPLAVSPMTWGIENNVIERFAGAGVPKEKVSFVRDTYTFNSPGTPSEFVSAFRKYYGPTMNAFDAAEKNGRANDLQKELETLFTSQNKGPNKDVTSIPATFLRVTVTT
jgi:hypothetical protein